MSRAGTGPGGEPAAGPRSGLRAVALIGFMAAGKSTVGARLARSLDWRFIDVDLEIERRTGLDIAALFRERGEPAFRRLEADLTEALLAENHAVLALGGGWAAQPGAFASLPHGVATVWLRVSAAEAVRRAAADPDSRPLLAGETDRVAAARRLLAQREAAYARAAVVVDVDGREPDDIVAEIVERLGVD